MSDRPNVCPTHEELARFNSGLPLNRQADDIARHIDDCPDCQSALKVLSANAGMLKTQSEEFNHGSEPEFLAARKQIKAIGLSNPPANQSRSPAPDRLPEQVGRYRIETILGQGGFGLVYLAHDDQLDRPVAVKVPHAKLLSQPEDALAYLTEARTVANLDHPHIVPVYDVGSTDEFPCFVVSKYIEGTNFSVRIREHRPSYLESAKLVATVGEALHYAHKQGIVHRDVKPGNILFGTDDKPYVVDFGLALREENIGKGPKYAGTPAYMSPEQARGEGHRVDGRSDIYSLGAVLYELLTGRRAFSGDTQLDILDQVTSQDPKPPRQIDDAIPKELERICLKALSKRASERYTTALDMTEDLTVFLAEHTTAPGSNTSAGGTPPSADSTQGPADSSTPSSSTPSSSTLSSGTPSSGTLNSDSQPIRIVPKGLRSFDEHDADFFLELLPGARDREGLPDSLRFWKTRIEQTDPDKTFPVGLIYGPSGCGKSSLVKAGLLPRLSDAVIPIYIEATPDETEVRLLRGLRKHCPDLADNLSLQDTLAAFRRGAGSPAGEKVLIVLDQFEQWLHTHRDKEDTDLVQALRQCDGGSLQCIVMVRDDFWMAATRFMRELEVRLVEAQNSAAVDLFPIRHARKVLAALGRAFGALPDDDNQMSTEQKDFCKESVASLAQDGKVICVRLALYAEMMKGRSWTPTTLTEVGGTEGVRVTFLEETFSASTAPPGHRYHQKAARAVLKALLPESGTEIKGQMKSHDELLRASSYANRPQDFDGLLDILDGELRLITPTDPEAVALESESTTTVPAGQKYYQLTHDYLVGSLRRWLTQKQQETARGRAELKLTARAELFNRSPETRHLPSLWEWIRIRTLTDPRQWKQPERSVMARARRHHGIRTLFTVVALLVVGVGAQRWLANTAAANRRERASALVTAVVTAPPPAVPYAAARLESLREESLPLLRSQFEDSTVAPQYRLHAALALARLGEVETPFLVESISGAAADECPNIVAALDEVSATALESIAEQAVEAEGRKDWKSKARLAITALYLRDHTLAAEMSRQRSDPIQRTLFIETFSTWHTDLDRLVDSVVQFDDADFRSAMCLAIGSVPIDKLSLADRQRWAPVFEEWYWQPDALTHSAADWAIRRWNLELPAQPESSEDRQWLLNSVGMTMVNINPGTFVRTDSYLDLDRYAHERHQERVYQSVELTRSFLISDKEVTRAQFLEFMNDPDVPADQKPADWVSPAQFTPTAEHPAQKVAWFNAMMFCNWLSRKEGFTPCYQGSARDWGTIPDVDGYRLPSEAEYEYVCRAGTKTTYSFGDDDSLLDRYAAVGTTRPSVVGSHMPNGWGVFDVHGNLYEWCSDWKAPYGTAKRVIDPHGAIVQSGTRILRGGSFSHGAIEARSTHRFSYGHHRDFDYIGFRVARTPGLVRPQPVDGVEIKEPAPPTDDPRVKQIVSRNARWLYTTANSYYVDEQLRVGDFDGDGCCDIFNATGSTWRISKCATSEWEKLTDADEGCPELRFGDFNGDGTTDVLKADGTTWWVQLAPNWGTWQRHNSLPDDLHNVRFADFNGDGRTDTFRASGLPRRVWEVSYGCSGKWTPINRSELLVEFLGFGDFDGDGRTDIFNSRIRHTSDRYGAQFVWWGARGEEQQVSTWYPMDWRRFGDFNGNGTTDTWMAHNRRSQWCESLIGPLLWCDPEITRADNISAGDFDGDGRSDIFRIEEGSWKISYQAQGPSRVVRREGRVTDRDPTDSANAVAPLRLVVTTTDDELDADPLANPDDLSLREALDLANASVTSAADTIKFDPNVFSSPQVIKLDFGELPVSDSVAIDGPGQELLTIDAQYKSRLLLVDDRDASTYLAVSISGLTLKHGQATDGDDASDTPLDEGGAILSREELTLADCTVSENGSAGNGGGIATVTSGGTLSVRRCTISGNTAGTDGGGLSAQLAIITNSLISENTAQNDGGGIAYSISGLAMSNSTVSGNTAAHDGGGILIDASATLTNVTIANNSCGSRGGGIHLTTAYHVVYSQNIIIAQNQAQTGGNDVQGDIKARYSLIQDIDGTTLEGARNIIGEDPQLAPLASNGGPTWTHALLPDSPAIDAGAPNYRASPPDDNDQRGPGFARISAGLKNGPRVIDMGAFEVASGPPAAP